MKYVMFYTTNDYEEEKTDIDTLEFDDFEAMMRIFTLLCETRGNVLVIEPNTKKVVCHFKSDGKVLFNKALMDSTIYVNNPE